MQELRGPRAVLRQSLGRDCVGNHDLRRRAAAELMLQPRVLIVEGGRARNVEPPRGHRQLVRTVRESDVELPFAGPAPQGVQPCPHRAELPKPGTPAVFADDVRIDPVQLEQLQCLRVVARGDLDVRAALAK